MLWCLCMFFLSSIQENKCLECCRTQTVFFLRNIFSPDIWYWVRKTANRNLQFGILYSRIYIYTKNIFHSCSVFDRLSYKLYAVACLFIRSSIEMYLHIYICATVCTCTCANCRYLCVCRALCLHLVYHVQISMIMRVPLSEKKSEPNKKTFIRIIHIWNMQTAQYSSRLYRADKRRRRWQLLANS